MLPLEDNDYKQTRIVIYSVLLMICIFYILYIFYIDSENNEKEEEIRNEFYANVELDSAYAMRKFILDTLGEDKINNSKKNKLYKQLKQSLFITLSINVLKMNNLISISDLLLSTLIANVALVIAS